MDKEFLKKYKLQEAVKRFQEINEYTFITSPMIAEDGEEEEQQPQQGNEEQPQNPNDMVQEPQGDEQMGGNGEVPMDAAPQGNETMPQADVNDGQMMGDNAPMDNMQMNGGDEEMMDDGMDTQQEGDTVVDIDELTNSQEATEYKVDGVDDKLTRMLNVLTKFSAALEASDKKIDDLKQEFEKRNPSEQEKLNIRSQASYPYSETPKSYWDNKTLTNPHYNVMYDNEVSTADEDKKFDITQDDIKDFNYQSISDSFDIDKMKLDDFMKF